MVPVRSTGMERLAGFTASGVLALSTNSCSSPTCGPISLAVALILATVAPGGCRMTPVRRRRPSPSARIGAGRRRHRHRGHRACGHAGGRPFSKPVEDLFRARPRKVLEQDNHLLRVAADGACFADDQRCGEEVLLLQPEMRMHPTRTGRRGWKVE